MLSDPSKYFEHDNRLTSYAEIFQPILTKNQVSSKVDEIFNDIRKSKIILKFFSFNFISWKIYFNLIAIQELSLEENYILVENLNEFDFKHLEDDWLIVWLKQSKINRIKPNQIKLS